MLIIPLIHIIKQKINSITIPTEHYIYMDKKYSRSKKSLSYHKPLLIEKTSDYLPDLSSLHKNSHSTHIPEAFFQSLSTKNLPIAPLKPIKTLHSKSNSLKTMPKKHHSIDYRTPVYKNSLKQNIFNTSESIQTQLNPHTVLTYFKFDLTEYEKLEILKYNDIYFFGKICNKLNQKSGFDDPRGDYLFKIGDHIAYRYEILKLLGKGSFGQVLLCQDHKRNEKVAVKIARNKKRFTKQASVEVKVLQAMKDNDIDGKKSVIKIKTFLIFRKHVCMVFEQMAMNLFELLQQNNFEGFPVGLIRKFTEQILNCLELAGKLKIIHCDLKPENIMLVNKNSTSINVIDFGTSCYEHEKIYTYIQSRFYRSPEIILEIPYTSAIDMWSLGCIVCEFFIGYPLFQGDSESGQIRFFIQTLGVPSQSLLNRSSKSKSYFDKQGNPLPSLNLEDQKHEKAKPLNDLLQNAPTDLKDFIKKCLDWDPLTRLNPTEALKHPFIAQTKKTTRKNNTKKLSIK